MKGTKNLSILILASIALGVSIENALADDGKISGFSELYTVGKTAAARLPEIAKVAPEALQEAKDLTTIEVVDLVKEVRKQAAYKNFSDSKISKWVEAGLDIVEALGKFTNKDGEPVLIAGNVRQALKSMQIQEIKDLKPVA